MDAVNQSISATNNALGNGAALALVGAAQATVARPFTLDTKVLYGMPHSYSAVKVC